MYHSNRGYCQESLHRIIQPHFSEFSRKLTPAQNKPELKMDQKDWPDMRLRVYHILT